MKAIEVETAVGGTPTQTTPNLGVVKHEAQAVGQPLSPAEITARLEFIKQVMAENMTEGIDYGKIPGCGEKPGLFQPGAQKLSLSFQLNPELKQEIVTEYENHHKGYRTVVRVSNTSGSRVADGVGESSTLESKYRWTRASRKCPNCQKEAVIKGKQEWGGGWLCYKKKGGCGAKWPDGAKEIESQSESKVEADNAPDYWNTVRKMAFKRAFVHAIINATNTSELWTQDIDDSGASDSGSHRDEYIEPEPPPIQQKTSPPLQKATPPVQTTAATQQTTKRATAKTKEWMIKALQPVAGFAIAYFRANGKLKADQTLEHLPLDHVPTSRAELDALVGKIWEFADKTAAGNDEPPTDVLPEEPPTNGEAWRQFKMPWGAHKGIMLDKIPLPQQDRVRYFYGLWNRLAVGPTCTQEFRAALDEMGRHYQFTKKEEA